MSFCSVTVNVCGWPTSFVAFGVIVILALTQRFVAGPELPPRPFVSRVSETPPTETVVEAFTVVDAGDRRGEVIEQRAGAADRGAGRSTAGRR